MERTLTDEELNVIIEKIEEILVKVANVLENIKYEVLINIVVK